MTFAAKQIDALNGPLISANVKEREQAGRKFSYIEAWHGIAEANRIFGFDAWDRETVDLRQLGDPREVDGKWRVGYMARVRITVRAGDDSVVVREGCGFGSGIDRDQGQAHESALKEAESDAMKRALMTFGNPFGLALYDKTKANVAHSEPEIDQAAERGIEMLHEKAKGGAPAFKAFWEMNKDAWKTGLTPQGYAAVVHAMQEIATSLKPKAVA